MIKNISKLLLLLSLYFILTPYVIIEAINLIFPKLIVVNFVNIIAVGVLYQVFTSKVRISFKK